MLEMATIEENETRELVDPLIWCCPIGLKWVSQKASCNVKGSILKVFLRLVDGIRAATARFGSGEGLGRSSSRREVRIPQRGARRRGVRAIAPWLHHRWPGA